MKKIFIAIAILLFAVSAYAEIISITLVWDRNTESDLAGYKLYSSDVSGDYSDIPIETIIKDSNTITIEMDVTTDIYFVLTAYDTANNESGYSNQVIFIDYPYPPENLKIKSYTMVSIQGVYESANINKKIIQLLDELRKSDK